MCFITAKVMPFDLRTVQYGGREKEREGERHRETESERLSTVPFHVIARQFYDPALSRQVCLISCRADNSSCVILSCSRRLDLILAQHFIMMGRQESAVHTDMGSVWYGLF